MRLRGTRMAACVQNASVQRAHRQHATHARSQEYFIGPHQLFLCHRPHTGVRQGLQQRTAQHARHTTNIDRRGQQHVVDADEHVGRRRGNQIVRLVEQQAFDHVRIRPFPAGEHLFNYSPPDESFLYQRLLIPAGVTPRRFSLIQLTEAMIELTKAGLGICALANWAVDPHVRAGTLCAIPITAAGTSRRWYSATRAARSKPAHLREFEQFVAGAVMGTPEPGHTLPDIAPRPLTLAS